MAIGIASRLPFHLGFSDHRPGGLRCPGAAHPAGMARALQGEWPGGQLLQGRKPRAVHHVSIETYGKGGLERMRMG